jgi:hypothetical protein
MAGARSRGGIPVRLARLRGRLGAAAVAAGRRALVAARGETARRLGRLAALTVVLALLVVVLYDHADVPSAAARSSPGGARAAAAGQAGTPAGPEASGRAGPEAAGRAGPGDTGSATDQARPGGGRGETATSGGRAAPGAAGERPAKVKRPAKPAEVAAAWYAARHKLPRSRVRPLQQDRVSARQVRVLVLAEAGNGKLRTALVRVRLGPGGWEVR